DVSVLIRLHAARCRRLPYTTLFRSKTSEFALTLERLTALTGESAQSMGELAIVADKFGVDAGRLSQIVGFTEKTLGRLGQTSARSEEHTSELQSRVDLVCRLLLEKK